MYMYCLVSQHALKQGAMVGTGTEACTMCNSCVGAINHVTIDHGIVPQDGLKLATMMDNSTKITVSRGGDGSLLLKAPSSSAKILEKDIYACKVGRQ
jgi:hypothetical protein